MKKAILSAIVASALVLPCYAQNTSSDDVDNRAEAKASIEGLLTKAEQSVNNPDRLNGIIHEFRRDTARAYMTPEDRREITKRLVKIFYLLDDSLTNLANKERIMEIIGFSDNSPEAHELFLKVLDSDDEKHREMALWGIRARGVHGDDLYAKIQSLERAGKISRMRSIQCIAKANPARAIVEMKNILKTTRSIKEFVLVGANLPEGYDENDDIVDIIVDRYDELKLHPISREDSGYSPERAVLSKTLWKYVDKREGTRLGAALDMLAAKGVCRRDDLRILERKVKSLDKGTREAVVDFLGRQVKSGNLKRKDVLPILDDAKNRESNQRLKQRIDNTIREVASVEGK